MKGLRHRKASPFLRIWSGALSGRLRKYRSIRAAVLKPKVYERQNETGWQDGQDGNCPLIHLRAHPVHPVKRSFLVQTGGGLSPPLSERFDAPDTLPCLRNRPLGFVPR